MVLCLFVFCFRLVSFTEAAALRSIILRYAACAPTATRSYLTTTCLLFCFSFFSEHFLCHCRFIFVWRVRRTFFPLQDDGVPCDHGGLGFLHISLLRENSTNSIKNMKTSDQTRQRGHSLSTEGVGVCVFFTLLTDRASTIAIKKRGC